MNVFSSANSVTDLINSSVSAGAALFAWTLATELKYTVYDEPDLTMLTTKISIEQGIVSFPFIKDIRVLSVLTTESS